MNDSLILGFGSEILADENIVPRICSSLNHELQGIDLILNPVLSIDLLPGVEDYKRLIFIDTVLVGEKEPGYVHFLSLENYKPTLHLENYHDISLKTFIELGIHLGFNITQDIMIIAIEIRENLNISEKMTDQLEGEQDEILKRIKGFLLANQYLRNN